MTTLSKEQVQSNIVRISNATTQVELDILAQQISLSDIDDKARSFLTRALLIQQRNITAVRELGTMCEGSELSSGDLSDLS